MQSSVPVHYYDLTRFENPEYRDGYLETKVYGGIAYQVQGLREKFDLTQKEFGQKVGLKQNAVSRLESIEYGKATIRTLLRIARRCDVALVVQFVSYPEFLDRTADMSASRLQPPTVYESVEAQKQQRLLLATAASTSVSYAPSFQVIDAVDLRQIANRARWQEGVPLAVDTATEARAYVLQ